MTFAPVAAAEVAAAKRKYSGGMPLELFAFRYFDLLRGGWLRARYRATREEIAARFERWEIVGPRRSAPTIR